MPNLVQIRPWQMGEISPNIFLFIPFLGTHLQVRPVDGFSHLMAQTTGTRARVCLFGVSLILLLILEVKSPQKNNFGGVNRLFQAKLAKYCEFHIIETADRFQPNFAKRQRPPSGHRGWSQYAPNKFKMADGRHLAKSVKSLYLCNLLTDFDDIWLTDAHWPLTADRPLKFRIFENPRWRRPPSLKSQKSRYLHNGLTDLYEIWYGDAY